MSDPETAGPSLDLRITCQLQAKLINQLRAALTQFVYEATHLSPREDDGSHRCHISAETLQLAREALKNV